MKIRKALKTDAHQIKLMMKELFLTLDKIDPMDKIDKIWFESNSSDKFTAKRISSKGKKYFVAEENGRLVGYLYLVIETRMACADKKVGLIDEMYVSPQFRKQGVGKRLFAEAMKWFRSNKIKWGIVLTHKLDDCANSFWQHHRFKEYNIKYRLKL